MYEGKDSPSSPELSEPHKPSSIASMSQSQAGLDKGKAKMPKYEVDHPKKSDSDVSAPSLDSEFGVPIMQTTAVKKMLTSENEKLWRSSR